nr:hypothetical protein [Chitinophagaceae bacterium]
MSATSNNPYIGLRPFDVDESLLFFGRNNQTLELLQRLHQHHFVSVVGSSGSGKSSLIRAGLIPSLKAGYLMEDSDQWLIVIMKPGRSPLYNLAEAILSQIPEKNNAVSIEALVQEIMEVGSEVIVHLMQQIQKDTNINFFLLVDQFEELFRFAAEQKDVSRQDEAIEFVNSILELAKQQTVPFFVVITMRSDFIGDCSLFYGLPEAMNESQYLVPRLNRVQLKTVIEGPAKLFGGKLDASLTSRILNDLGKVKDELPLLQHALMRLWDYETKVHQDDNLGLDDYLGIGGLEKALCIHADEALIGMSDRELFITKRMFQSLTAIDSNGRKIRRPVLLSQLKELTGATSEELEHIIDCFIKEGRSFLIISVLGDSTDKIIDISHESFIRQWDKLGSWVDEEGESAAYYLQLVEALRLYQLKKKDLLAGSELQLMLDWRNRFKPIAVWANRYKNGFVESLAYLEASEQEQLRLIGIEKARKKKQSYLIYSIMGLLFAMCLAAVIATTI